jgi:putative spermidine/putrescine transport system substrate-binding protein
MSQQSIGRREFVQQAGLAGALGALAPALLGEAAAQPREIVLANWGGEAVKAMKEAFADPFEKATGIKVAIDTTGPSAGKVRAMVESGKVTWDVCDATTALSIELGRAGLLEEIDYAIVDRKKTIERFAYRWGVCSYMYSSVLIYDRAKFKDKAPERWADFWNLKDFPGKRLMRRDVTAMLEPALLADGVPKDKLYPLDVKRGFDKIRQIKSECLFWRSAAEAVQLLRDGEVVMGNAWNTRALALRRSTDGRVDWTWNEGILQPAVWAVPKGNPAGKETVMKFIASMQQPEAQVALLRTLASGPANPLAAAAVPPELQGENPSSAENIAKQIPVDAEWYADNYKDANDRYLDLISS